MSDEGGVRIDRVEARIAIIIIAIHGLHHWYYNHDNLHPAGWCCCVCGELLLLLLLQISFLALTRSWPKACGSQVLGPWSLPQHAFPHPCPIHGVAQIVPYAGCAGGTASCGPPCGKGFPEAGQGETLEQRTAVQSADLSVHRSESDAERRQSRMGAPRCRFRD